MHSNIDVVTVWALPFDEQCGFCDVKAPTQFLLFDDEQAAEFRDMQRSCKVHAVCLPSDAVRVTPGSNRIYARTSHA